MLAGFGLNDRHQNTLDAALACACCQCWRERPSRVWLFELCITVPTKQLCINL